MGLIAWLTPLYETDEGKQWESSMAQHASVSRPYRSSVHLRRTRLPAGKVILMTVKHELSMLLMLSAFAAANFGRDSPSHPASSFPVPRPDCRSRLHC